MLNDPQRAKVTVAAGYDRIGDAYARLVEHGGMTVRGRYLQMLDQLLAPGARVVELGCGAASPMTATLAARFDVAALDISLRQLAKARGNAPAARLIRTDIARLPSPPLAPMPSPRSTPSRMSHALSMRCCSVRSIASCVRAASRC
jgi:SAM-dependent methyltransferase